MGVGVLSGEGGVARGVMFSGSEVFSLILWRLCEGAGLGGWRAIGRDGGG